ncbi:MAG TPA: hypothetical protein PKY59_19915 [Pyrinomonadaceae bacterium]|nr:hypothetical protein [Pyrinomonadaceae bacterium]
MKKTFGVFVSLFALLFVFSFQTKAQLTVQAVDVAGDSISKGFNAGNSFPCSNGDQEQYNWFSSDTHGSDFCGAGSEGVNSFLERLECEYNSNILARNPNSAASGSQMLSDFVNQSNSIKTYLGAQNGQRLAAVFLGHNDNCGGNVTKTNASCSSNDKDPNNYCKTKPDSFEREFRKGLDILITTGNTRIGVVSPVRVSQLCNFGSKSNCQVGGTCQFLWGVVNICASLTRDCSTTRIVDSYTTMSAYREILKRVTAEYAAIPVGGNSPVVTIGGEIVGGVTKAAGTDLVYSDAPWFYKFNADQLSCCDCFHPSGLGQNELSKMLKIGLSCTRLQPCCRDTGDPLVDGKCTRTEVKRVYYRGLL